MIGYEFTRVFVDFGPYILWCFIGLGLAFGISHVSRFLGRQDILKRMDLYLPEEVKKIHMENVKLKSQLKTLRERVKILTDTLSGVRFLVRKTEE